MRRSTWGVGLNMFFHLPTPFRGRQNTDMHIFEDWFCSLKCFVLILFCCISFFTCSVFDVLAFLNCTWQSIWQNVTESDRHNLDIIYKWLLWYHCTCIGIQICYICMFLFFIPFSFLPFFLPFLLLLFFFFWLFLSSSGIKIIYKWV